ncbi:hypothetical protein ACWIG3_27090 [Streptomyces celluloflavus]|uniref:Uncharacterized protein n=1 Tax=Streptomyces celluloflavus TaxID=58344 RepID=A0ABW7RFN9_9ACTN|nr:hypothetical protein [Streptomyces kasugaensis]
MARNQLPAHERDWSDLVTFLCVRLDEAAEAAHAATELDRVMSALFI